jgi:hypothetical protein
VTNELGRLRRGYLDAIAQATLSPLDRAWSYAFFGAAWGRRNSWAARTIYQARLSRAARRRPAETSLTDL